MGRTRRATAKTDKPAPSQPAVADFEESYGFPFDDFQRRACESLIGGASVLVAAPTGAGKTVVGEFAAWLAMSGGGKTFYTTPVKALSNQKYGDFLQLHGSRNVGLLTGDNSVNGDAPVVVMTTEVLRNMIYEDSMALSGLKYVVLDEVHYLQDQYRGAVWEEILIHLPVDVQIVSLSATVSNAEEFGEWLMTLRGRTDVIIEERRPVDIEHWYFGADELLPMFVKRSDGTVMPNPRGRELDRRKSNGGRPNRGGKRAPQKRPRIPWRTDVVERLDSEGMLPAIYFIFSRKGCAEAVDQCLRQGIRLTTSDEARAIHEYADTRVADLPANELDVLGYDHWIEGLRRGVASHHAGMIPPFKEAVEDLFARGLVKVVFATETLALGINMPARSIVIESLMKFTGEKHEQMTPGEYTQLSGRAGRRGKDAIGHSVVLLQRFIPFEGITRLASTRTYPLQSSFRPSYNMTVNLVRNYDRREAEHLVNSSFAQFQADRDVVRLERKREKDAAYLATYRERMTCELGDFAEYHALVERSKSSSRARSGHAGTGSKVLEAIARLRPGDVVEIASGKRRGRYAVMEVTQRRSERAPRVLLLSEERSLVRFAPSDFREPPVAAARLPLPRGFQSRDQRTRRELGRRLARLEIAPVKVRERAQDVLVSPPGHPVEEEIEQHPCHACPERKRHLHYAERAARLERELQSVDRRMQRRTGTLAKRFDQVLAVLEQLDYVDEWRLTGKGETLTRVYNESDLLVVESIERRLFEALEPPEIAAVCSTLVYETRGPETGLVHDMPTPDSAEVWRQLMKLWRQVRREEEARGLELTREPDPGFARKAFRWASGSPLEKVLGEDDAPGDFVRSVKQLIDLLRQLADIATTPELAEKVEDAIRSLNRGVIAYSSLEL